MSNSNGGRNLSPGYIALTPIYRKRYKTYSNADVQSTPSTTYIVPIGRKELATVWWTNCPNHCMAHLPSSHERKPCKQYCQLLRKHVAYLSKQLITTTVTTNVSNGKEWDNNYNTNDIMVDSRFTRILIKHPHAIKNKQSNLIHIIPIDSTSSSSNNTIGTTTSLDETEIYYHLRIGNDMTHPWMEFRVSLIQQYTKLAMTRNVVAKRKLKFDTNTDTNVETKKKRQVRDRTLPHCCHHQKDVEYDDHGTQQYEVNHCPIGPKAEEFDGSRSISNHDILLDHSEEFEEGKPLSTQQQQQQQQQLLLLLLLMNTEENTTTTTSPAITPKQVSIHQMPQNVTPGTVWSTRPQQVNTESSTLRLSPQRQLFRTKEEKSSLTTQCERLFQDDDPIVISKSKIPPSLSLEGNYVDSDSDNNASDNEQYATYLSLPIPESYSSLFSNNCESPVSIFKPTKRNGKNSASVYDNDDAKHAIESHLLPSHRPAQKVIDLTLHQWKSMSKGQQTMKSTSQFQQTMIELILLNNDATSESITERQQVPVWLPPLFTKDTIMSASWKLSDAP